MACRYICFLVAYNASYFSKEGEVLSVMAYGQHCEIPTWNFSDMTVLIDDTFRMETRLRMRENKSSVLLYTSLRLQR